MSVWITRMQTWIPYSAKFGRGKNFGEFGKTNVIHQYFIQPVSRFTKVANVRYCKFANIFLAKTLKWSIRPKFCPSKFCAIWYAILCSLQGVCHSKLESLSAGNDLKSKLFLNQACRPACTWFLKVALK